MSLRRASSNVHPLMQMGEDAIIHREKRNQGIERQVNKMRKTDGDERTLKYN